MSDPTLDVVSEPGSIKTADGTADVTLHRPSQGGKYPAVLMFQDALGVRPIMHDMAKRLAGAGYSVLLPNLFYRNGPGRQMDFATEQQLIYSLIGSLTPARLSGDVKAFLEYLDKAPGTSTARVGAHGYCMGGGCALVAAATASNIVAAASFHGARLATDSPDSPHTLLPKVKARVYIGVAGLDQLLEPGETDRLKAALDAAKIKNEVEIYDNVQHGFAVAGNPAIYDKAASERHWKRLLDLYRETLK